MQERGFEAAGRIGCNIVSGADAIKCRGDVVVAPLVGVELLEAMVRRAASGVMKCGVPLLQRVEKLVDAVDRHARGSFETSDPAIEGDGIFDSEGRVGTPGR